MAHAFVSWLSPTEVQPSKVTVSTQTFSAKTSQNDHKGTHTEPITAPPAPSKLHLAVGWNWTNCDSKGKYSYAVFDTEHKAWCHLFALEMQADHAWFRNHKKTSDAEFRSSARIRGDEFSITEHIVAEYAKSLFVLEDCRNRALLLTPWTVRSYLAQCTFNTNILEYKVLTLDTPK